MATKIKAARLASRSGTDTIIVDGKKSTILTDVASGKLRFNVSFGAPFYTMARSTKTTDIVGLGLCCDTSKFPKLLSAATLRFLAAHDGSNLAAIDELIPTQTKGTPYTGS
jgi:hypothetical protein